MVDTDYARIVEEHRQLRRAVDELKLLNELAVTMGNEREVEAMIGALVKRAIDVIGATQGVVTLMPRGEAEDAHTMVRAVAGDGHALRPDQALLAWMGSNLQPLLLQDPKAHPVFGTFDWDASVHSLLAVPLMSNNQLLGVLTLYNKTGEEAFTTSDARLLTILASQSAQAIGAAKAEEEHTRVLNLFGRHTAPAVVEELLRHEAEPPIRRAQVCVMFLDIRGFTTFAEGAEPEAVVGYLNALFEFSSEAVAGRAGIVHQLLGDGFMAFFGAPITREDDCARAVAASLDIIARTEQEVAAGRLPPTRLGIGLHAGEVVAGTVGSIHHKEYKITGDVVNTTARVEGLNKEFDSQLLITGPVWDALPPEQQSGEDLGQVPLRGRMGSIQLYRRARAPTAWRTRPLPRPALTHPTDCERRRFQRRPDARRRLDDARRHAGGHVLRPTAWDHRRALPPDGDAGRGRDGRGLPRPRRAAPPRRRAQVSAQPPQP